MLECRHGHSTGDLLPTGFDQHLLSILESLPEGIDEFALIKRLAADYPQSLFAVPGALSDSLQLFRIHFLLFHMLYRASDSLNPRGGDCRSAQCALLFFQSHQAARACKWRIRCVLIIWTGSNGLQPMPQMCKTF